MRTRPPNSKPPTTFKRCAVMSRLEELIQRLCPDGVEYKKIGEITNIVRGKRLTKSRLLENGLYPVYHGSLSPLGYYHEANRDGDTVIIVNTGGIGGVGYSAMPFWCSDGCFCIEHCNFLLNKFVYYYLIGFQDYFISRIRTGGVPTIDRDTVAKIQIPVPPIEVQHEIVRILDSFTGLIAELTAELTARKKQYEYYRDELLNVEGRIKNVEWKKLGDIAIVTKLAGFEFTKYITYKEHGEIIALRGLNVKNGQLDLSDVKYIDGSDLTKLTRSKLCIGDMLFTYVGTVGQVALIEEDNKYYLAPNVALIRLLDKKAIFPKYLMYYFQTNAFKSTQIEKLLQSSSMQNIPMNKIRNFEIPVPTLEEQERIVAILDRFDKLCNDISQGLPAEIEARKKQYEYYRDKLLTFKELAE